MRRAAAILGITIALIGAFGFVAGFTWSAIVTSGIFIVALMAGALIALRGGDLVYLASAWGIFVGMNLAAYLDVIAHNYDTSGALFLTILLLVALLGLLLTLVARHREQNT